MRRQHKTLIGLKQDTGKYNILVVRERNISRPQYTSYRMNRDLSTNKILESRSGHKRSTGSMHTFYSMNNSNSNNTFVTSVQQTC